VAILVEGTDNFQLSEFSKPFTLRDQGIYTGDYEGFWIDEIIDIDYPEGTLCGARDESYSVSSTITGSIQDDYRGDFYLTDSTFRGVAFPDGEFPWYHQGSFSFKIVDNIISNFFYNQSIPCYAQNGGNATMNYSPLL